MASRNQADLERLQDRYDAIFEGISPPFAFVDLDAMRSNADVLAAQASPLPIRIASKSVRSTKVLERILGLKDSFRGILSFTLPEALHLARQGYEDIFVGYPTADRKALSELALLAAERPDTPPGADRGRAGAPRPDRVRRGARLGADPGRDRHRPELVAGARARRAHRAEALADPYCRARAPLRG